MNSSSIVVLASDGGLVAAESRRIRLVTRFSGPESGLGLLPLGGSPGRDGTGLGLLGRLLPGVVPGAVPGGGGRRASRSRRWVWLVPVRMIRSHALPGSIDIVWVIPRGIGARTRDISTKICSVALSTGRTWLCLCLCRIAGGWTRILLPYILIRITPYPR